MSSSNKNLHLTKEKRKIIEIGIEKDQIILKSYLLKNKSFKECMK